MQKKKSGSSKVPLFNGKPFDLHPPGPALIKLKKKFDSMHNEGVFSPKEICSRLGVARCTVSSFTANANFKDYWHKYGGLGGGQVALGHPKEVKAFAQYLLSAERDSNES